MVQFHRFLALLVIAWMALLAHPAPLASSSNYTSLNLITITDEPSYLSLLASDRSSTLIPHFALLLYHRFDCPQCASWMPVFENWAATLPPDLPFGSGTLFTLSLGRVDCGNASLLANESSKAICQGIERVPTIRLYRNGMYIATAVLQGNDQTKGLSQFLFSYLENLSESHILTDYQRNHPSLAQLARPTLPLHDDASGNPTLPSASINLTAANFNASTGSGYWLVKFFAPWCSHCKALAPIWEDVAAASLSHGYYEHGVRIGSVDCTVHGSLCHDMHVQGYPTIQYRLDGGEWAECLAERKLDSYLKFIQKNLLPSAEGEGLAKWMTEADFLAKKSNMNLTDAIEPRAFFLYLFDSNSPSDMEDGLVVEAAATFQFEQNKADLYFSHDQGIRDLVSPKSQTRLPWMVFVEPESALVEILPMSPLLAPDELSVWIHDRLFPGLSFLNVRNARPILGMSDRLILLAIMDKRRPEAGQYYEQLHTAALQFQSQAYKADLDSYCRLKFAAIDKVDFAAYIHRVYGEKDQDGLRVILIDPKNQIYYDDIDLFQYSNTGNQSQSQSTGMIRREGLEALVQAYQSQNLSSPASRVRQSSSSEIWPSDDWSIHRGLIGFLLLAVLVLLFGLMGIRWSKKQYRLIPNPSLEEKPRKE